MTEPCTPYVEEARTNKGSIVKVAYRTCDHLKIVDLAVAAMRVVNFAVAAILVKSDPSVYR